MYVKIKSLDGSKNCVLVLSKRTTIGDMKTQIDETLDVPISKQRLFYKGKQLEDEYMLFDYDVKLNDVIQLMIKADVEKDTQSKDDNSSKENVEPNAKKPSANAEATSSTTNESSSESAEDFVDLKPATSKYYKVGDYVDAILASEGAWFESQITHILIDITKDEPYSEDDIVFKVIYLKYKDDGSSTLKFDDIRPLAKHLITEFTEDLLGVRVMGNYNTEEPRDRGYWHDMVIEKKQGRRLNTDITATVYIGKKNSETRLENCKIKFVKELYKIEEPKLLTERTTEDEEYMTTEPKTLRLIVPDCSTCDDIETKKCKDCGCALCAGKTSPDKLIVCEECQHYFHIWCLKPPLETIPEDDEWFCPGCKRDTSEVIAPGQKLKDSKKKARMASSKSTSTRDWGKGMACVGRTKVCTIVPSDHFGPIPGIEVGQTFLYRVQASEAGVHRPHVSGIHGREDVGAFSLVLSGGYEDDVDDGDSFLYTGSGGRDLSGNRRTNVQSSDQTLTRMNKALAKNCNAPLDDEKGNEAVNWKKGKPVRVMRNANAAKHSKYAPKEGNRYDGIYKIVKYYPVKGSSNFIVWRYQLRRDDPDPAPWTEEGKKRIKDLGLQMIYPEGYEEAQAAKEASKSMKRKGSDDKDSTTEAKSKKVKHEYTLPLSIQEHIKNDTAHSSVWDEIKELCQEGQKQVLEFIQEKFLCIICQELVFKPVTLDCVHSFCHDCLKRAFKIDSESCNSCPYCRKEIDKSVLETQSNDSLQNILNVLFPGYNNGR
uniref:RING-type E3 ubiquitin transferase n=1 Tax=Cacopsylla melanoneura TaxID=428564 RepID=A0A8D8VVT0_9HEMI